MRYEKRDFSGGELAPELYGRTDLDEYSAGCKTLLNALPLPMGGATRRPGTKYIATVKATGTDWIVRRFRFSTSDAYVFEIGDYYLRVFKNDGTAVTVISTGLAYEVTTPWADDDIRELKFTQSADTVFVTHPDYQPMLITRSVDATTSSGYGFTVSTYDFVDGPYRADNASTTTITPDGVTSPTKTITGITKDNPGVVTSAGHGLSDGDEVFIYGVVGMTELNNKTFTVRNKGTDTFELDYNASGASLDTSTPSYTAYLSGGTAAKCVKLTASSGTPFSNRTGAAHSGSRCLWKVNHWIPAQNTSSAFTATGETASIKCGGSWRLLTHGTWTGTIEVRVSEDGGTTWTACRVYKSVGDKNFQEYVVDTFAQQYLVKAVVTAFSGTTTLTIDLSSDPFEWHGVGLVVQVPSGGGGMSTDYSTADVVVLKEFGGNTATTVWAEGSWSNYRGWPRCSAFYQNRLVFAGNDGESDTVWCSKVDNYYDYSTSFPIADDDGISTRMPSKEMNVIHNLGVINSLLALTSGGNYSATTGTDGVLSPKTIGWRAHDLSGASDMTPAVINNRIVYAQTFNKILRDTGYSYEEDGFVGVNLNKNAAHIFEEYAAVEMDYQNEPWHTLWIVREDGKLCSLTYLTELKKVAWAVHATHSGTNYGIDLSRWKRTIYGEILSVCVCPGIDQDDVWVVAKRRNGGGAANLITIEKLDRPTDDPWQQKYLDCYVEFESPKTIEGAYSSSGELTLTVTGHGYSDGDEVELDDIGFGYLGLNKNRYTVVKITDNAFKCLGASVSIGAAYLTSIFVGATVRRVYPTGTSFSGLGALEGMYVSVLINGYAFSGTASSEGATYVSSGAISLDSMAKGSVITIGLNYLTEIETMVIEKSVDGKSTKGKMIDVKTVSLTLQDTYGGRIGCKRDIAENTYIEYWNLLPLAITDENNAQLKHSLTSGQPTGEPPALYSGEYVQTINSGPQNAATIIIQQGEAYPLTVLGISAEVSVES